MLNMMVEPDSLQDDFLYSNESNLSCCTEGSSCEVCVCPRNLKICLDFNVVGNPCQSVILSLGEMPS